MAEFLSALRTKSSAVAPSKTGIFLIVIAIVMNFMQMYYFIVIQQNGVQDLTDVKDGLYQELRFYLYSEVFASKVQYPLSVNEKVI